MTNNTRFFKKLTGVYLTLSLATSLFFGCATTVEKPKPVYIERVNETGIYDTISIKNDSLNYEIVIIEFGFDEWMKLQKPSGYYTKGYLVRSNKIMLTEYNSRVLDRERNSAELYPEPIEYNFFVDYGYEVNYLLYHYFLFFQEKYRQKLR